MIGETILQYQILEKLGAGGMGVVYKAVDTRLNRTVALKFLPEYEEADETDRARFLQEARAASAINHPNVCVIYDLKEYEGEQFIVMEYVEGRTLKQLTADGELIPVEKAVDYALQISDAMQAAHEKGILHRDIKSENIMVTSSGQIKVMDFGLALVKGSQRLTRSSSTVGTIAYMSPEQIEGKAVDTRADIFSFGVVFYELLTGHLPFSGDNQAAVIHAILNHPPTPMENFRQLAPEIIELVYHALEKDVTDRFQSFQKIREELLRIRQGNINEPSSRKRRRTVPRKSTSGKFRKLLPSIILLVILSVAAVSIIQRVKAGKKPPMNIVQLTTSAGAAEGASFSPDGKQVAYHWDQAGKNNDIFVHQIRTNQILQLTTNPGEDVWPAWSPDGQYIVFCRLGSTDEESGLFLISSLGGVERKIYFKEGWNPSWSPDGRLISFFGFNPSGVFVLELASGKAQQLTSPPISYIPYYGTADSEFSPDGKTLAYIQFNSYGVSEIYLIPSGGGIPRQITHDNKKVLGLTWISDGKRLIFSSDRSTSQKLWSMRRNGSGLKLLEVGGQYSIQPTISKGGRRLAFSEVRGGNFDVGRIRLNGDLKPQLPEKLIASQKDELTLDRSPDGKQCAFGSNRSGFSEIWKCDSDGNNILQLTTLNTLTGTPRWSPDGSLIAFDCRSYGNSDIFVIPSGGGSPIRITSDIRDELLPSWSIDGAWLYYCLDHEGECQIWKIPSAGGTPVQVVKNNGYVALEAPDGQSIYYTKRHDPNLWQCDIIGENERIVFEFSEDYRLWAMHRQGIYFLKLNSADELIHVHFYDFVTHKISTLATLGQLYSVFNPVVSLDRQWLYLSYMEQFPQSDIILVDNFE